MRRRDRPVWALMLVVGVSGCSELSDGTGGGDRALPPSLSRWPASIERPRFSPDGRRIAFSSMVDGVSDLYVVDSATDDVKRLTNTPHQDRRPAWSPDGSRIVFQSDREGGQSLWTLDLSDLSVRRLTTDAQTASAPDWSPRGDWITYVSDASGSWDLWRVRSDGTEAQPVTSHPGNEYHPRFSPDGSEIVFYPTWSGWTDIYVVDVETAELREILSSEHEDYRPAYDPTGSRIVFASDREQSSGLWVVNSSGGDPVRLHASSGGLDYPDWSPDGRWVLHLEEMHSSQLLSVGIEGGESTPVTDAVSPAMDRHPAVSPDGAWLAYESDRLGNEGNVVLRRFATRDERRLSRGRVNDGAPRFSPDSSRIVYTSGGGDQASSEAVVASVASVDGEAGVAWTDVGNVGFPAFCGLDRVVYTWAAVAYTAPHELWSVREGDEPARLGAHTVERTGASCDDDGRWLIASLYQPPGDVDTRPRLVRIDIASGSTSVLTEDTVPHLQPRLSPDGELIAYIRGGAESGQLFVVPSEGGEPRAVLEPSLAIGSAVWVGNERLIYSLVTRKDFARTVRVPDGR